MLDKRLLVLMKYMKKEQLTMQGIAEELKVSMRQLSRLLNTWQDNGWLEFKPGLGRGKPVEIAMLIDVEQDLFYELVNRKKHLSLAEINDYLSLPWQPSVLSPLRELLLGQFHNMLDLTIMDFFFKIPELIHPALTLDLPNAQLAMHTMETLYTIDMDGSLHRGLVKFDEWKGTELHLYLNEGIRFSDFTPLTAEHVQQGLLFLKDESEFQLLFDNIEEVKIYDELHLSIRYTHASDSVKYLLAEPFSSIYTTDKSGELIGSGPYYIKERTDEQIILQYNPAYIKEVADVKTIYMLLETDENIRNEVKKRKINESLILYWGDEYIIFNPLTDRFTLDERAYLTNLMRYIIQEEMDRPVGLYTWSYSPVTLMEPIEINKTVKILIDKRFGTHVRTLGRKLMDRGINVELIETEHEAFLMQDIGLIDADIVWMHEYVHQTQPLKTFGMLTYCKFKEWFQPVPVYSELLNHMKERPLGEEGEQFIQQIEDEYYFVPLFVRQRRIYVPPEFDNFEIQSYSTIKYHKIIRL